MQVPIYWGDPVHYDVFSRSRVLVLDEIRFPGDLSDRPVTPRNMSDVLRIVERLETEAAFRKEFFSVPLLAPSATAVVANLCDSAVRILREASKKYPAMHAHAERAIAGEKDAGLANLQPRQPSTKTTPLARDTN